MFTSERARPGFCRSASPALPALTRWADRQIGCNHATPASYVRVSIDAAQGFAEAPSRDRHSLSAASPEHRFMAPARKPSKLPPSRRRQAQTQRTSSHRLRQPNTTMHGVASRLPSKRISCGATSNSTKQKSALKLEGACPRPFFSIPFRLHFKGPHRGRKERCEAGIQSGAVFRDAA
jgi:hypothetical protein